MIAIALKKREREKVITALFPSLPTVVLKPYNSLEVR